MYLCSEKRISYGIANAAFYDKIDTAFTYLNKETDLFKVVNVPMIYDDRLLVKPVKSAVRYMPTAPYELPYDAQTHFPCKL